MISSRPSGACLSSTGPPSRKLQTPWGMPRTLVARGASLVQIPFPSLVMSHETLQYPHCRSMVGAKRVRCYSMNFACSIGLS